VGDQCSISRPIHRGQAVPRRAALLQVEQPPEARQGSPLAARQAVAAARLAADTQQGRAAGAVARRQPAGVARQALHPMERYHLAETSALGRRRAR
jgi:hypothetical protein